MNTYGKSTGHSGSYSTNYQIGGRELMTPDEVRMLDNKYAILFIRGERPVKDLKYDILKHPNVVYTTDGKEKAYEHGSINNSVASLVVDYNIQNYDFKDIEEIAKDYEVIYCEDMDNYLNGKDEENEKGN